MNLGRYETALGHFLRFKNIKEAVNFAAHCYKALNDDDNAQVNSRKLEAM
jgi:hypothetical protein